jgi:hypothetical protein
MYRETITPLALITPVTAKIPPSDKKLLANII